MGHHRWNKSLWDPILMPPFIYRAYGIEAWVNEQRSRPFAPGLAKEPRKISPYKCHWEVLMDVHQNRSNWKEYVWTRAFPVATGVCFRLLGPFEVLNETPLSLDLLFPLWDNWIVALLEREKQTFQEIGPLKYRGAWPCWILTIGETDTSSSTKRYSRHLQSARLNYGGIVGNNSGLFVSPRLYWLWRCSQQSQAWYTQALPQSYTTISSGIYTPDNAEVCEGPCSSDDTTKGTADLSSLIAHRKRHSCEVDLMCWEKVLQVLLSR